MNHVMLVSLLMGTAFGLSACGAEKSTDGFTVDASEAAIESGIAAVDGIIDDQQNSSFAYLYSNPQPTLLESLQNALFPQAYAASCSRAASAMCSAGVKSETYSDCTGIYGRSFQGNVTLTYSDSSCSLSSNGDSVVRTYDVSIAGPRGGVVTSSSDTHTNYLGASLGGGGQLTKTVTGWDLDIMGKHKSFARNGTTYFDISVSTTSSIKVSGTLARTSRILDGGSLVVDHNVAGFTTTLTPSNLTFTAGCCYPTSGTMAVVYSGAKTGSGSVTFNGCGTASLNVGSSSKDINLSYCE